MVFTVEESDLAGLVSTEDQIQLAGVLKDFLERRSPESVVRRFMETESGLDIDTWTELAGQLGVCGLAVPEDLGGGGGTFIDVAVVIELLGAHLTCVPYFSSVVLAQSLILASGDSDAQKEMLPTLCDGSVRGTVAFAEPASSWDADGIAMMAEKSPDGWLLSGEKCYVIDGHTADLILVVARTGGELTVFAVDGKARGLTRVPLPTMDMTRKQSRLVFDRVQARLVGNEGQAERPFADMLDFAAIAMSAESVGGAQRVLDMAVDYAKTRFQFGRAIGSFQAIKHKCADMLLAVESARSAAYYARGVAAEGDSAELAMAAAMAKAYCQDAFMSSAEQNIQVHGGIGFTWEHSAHLYFKRAKANQLMFGGPVLHRSRLADMLGI